MKFAKVFIIIFVLISYYPSIGSAQVNHVVLVSLDGFKPDAISQFEKELPHFHRLMTEGSYTLNARTDVNYTVTIPNHTCMLTGRRVAGENGHRVTVNGQTNKTVHQLNGQYVSSIFDVLSQHGLSSTMAASKLKFDIFSKSYPITKTHITDQDDGQTLQYVLEQLKTDPPAFFFVHFSNLDATGHAEGWSVDGSSSYMKAVFKIDEYLGQLMDEIELLNAKEESTVLIITTDHGGINKSHENALNKKNYTIPFFLWGKNVPWGKDLYELNQDARMNPGEKQIQYENSKQPIRNGDAGNLALHLLGLECIPQSTINCSSPLVVEEPVK
ncbi:MAG: alkaline phosphatase family protein [Candidatus Omnitrophica bacterium]|nr:alkaline phosphatase family protein [Candidatus Omnitrophota bacterium]